LRLLAAAALAWPAALHAQGADLRARLDARGLPPDLAQGVAAVAEQASAQGLPGGAVADKAIEGWAKHVPAERILSAVGAYATRLGEARSMLGRTGLATPGPAVVVAAAEALGRGIAEEQVGQVVRAARAPGSLAPGLTVVAALRAQGLRATEAVGVVVGAMRRNRSVDQLLDLPSMARAMQGEGLEAGEIGKRMIRGVESGDGGGGDDHDGRPGAWPGSGSGHRPPGMPPGMPGEGENRPPSGQRPPGETPGGE
jgi:hypothetical protein